MRQPHETLTNMQLIVSTCGTSLLTHQATDAQRTLLNRTANLKAAELNQDDRQHIDEIVHQQRDTLMGITDFSQIRKISAELNGILGLYGNDIKGKTHDTHILLHTDTYQGEQVAEIISHWLQQRSLNVQLHKAKDLTTASLDDFQNGMNSLVHWSGETFPGYKQSNYLIVFNLVGGFKSFQGFMQTLGMFYADKIIYIFEGSSELLCIPRLPIRFNEEAEKVICDNLPVFRRLDGTRSLNQSEVDNGIPETFLYKLDSEVGLSPWGGLIWNQIKEKIYAAKRLEPLSERLEISIPVDKDFGELPSDKKKIFNERMDDLLHYLDSGMTTTLKRLDFKKLKGNPHPPCTHEFDLWEDRRGFGYFSSADSDKFILYFIGRGFH